MERYLTSKQGSQVGLGTLAVQLQSKYTIQRAGKKKRQPCTADHVSDVVKDAGFSQLAD